jgi:hypothetical protein
MLHDIDYLRFAEDQASTIAADIKAIKNADFDMPGIATKIGLYLRMKLFSNKFNKRLSGMTVQQTHLLGEQLLLLARSDPKYQQTFKKFGVEL